MRIQVQIVLNRAIQNTNKLRLDLTMTKHSPIAGQIQTIHDKEQDNDMATYKNQGGSHDKKYPIGNKTHDLDNQSKHDTLNRGTNSKETRGKGKHDKRNITTFKNKRLKTDLTYITDLTLHPLRVAPDALTKQKQNQKSPGGWWSRGRMGEGWRAMHTKGNRTWSVEQGREPWRSREPCRNRQSRGPWRSRGLWQSSWSRGQWWSRRSSGPWRSRRPWRSKRPWQSRWGMNLSGRNRTDHEFMDSLCGCDRADWEFMSGRHHLWRFCSRCHHLWRFCSRCHHLWRFCGRFCLLRRFYSRLVNRRGLWNRLVDRRGIWSRLLDSVKPTCSKWRPPLRAVW